MNSKTRRAENRAVHRTVQQARKLAAAQAREAADENIAPAAQRLPVMGANGALHALPRLVRDGRTFIRSSPIEHMAARGKASEVPLITARHVEAARRLAIAWEEGANPSGTSKS